MTFTAPDRPEVVTLGEVLAVLVSTDGVALRRARDFRLITAGSEANVAVGLARLGHRVAYVGRVGRDALGASVHRELRAEGVDVRTLTFDDDHPTGLIVRDAPHLGPTEVAYYRRGSAGAALLPEDLDHDAIRHARVLHVTGLTAALSTGAADAVDAAARTARDAGVTVTFDPNVRRRLGDQETWRTLVERIASCADVVLVGADDAAHVLPGLGHREVVAWFRERGCHTVVWKDGARGAVETSAGGPAVEQPAIPVVPRDAVGAGDAFAAGWISGWLDHVPPEERMRRGAAAAAAVVATLGDLPGLPDRDLLTALLGPDTEMNR